MAVAIENLHGTQGYRDALGRPVYVAEIEQARDNATPVEHVVQTRPAVHDGALPDGVQDLFQATGVFDAVGREEKRFQALQAEATAKSKVIDIATRRHPVEHPVYSAPERVASR